MGLERSSTNIHRLQEVVWRFILRTARSRWIPDYMLAAETLLKRGQECEQGDDAAREIYYAAAAEVVSKGVALGRTQFT